MKTIKIDKGCNIPIAGQPMQAISDGPQIMRFSVTASDFVGMKPTFHVAVGDTVRMGQVLFEDKKNPGAKFTAPCCGTVSAIVRGEKRAFREIVLERNPDGIALDFRDRVPRNLADAPTQEVMELLVDSGLWTALRARPFSRIPSPQMLPHSLFVTAIDTHPLAADPVLIIKERTEDFVQGLRVLSKICGEKLFLCIGLNDFWNLFRDALPVSDLPNLEMVAFTGPHPAGLPGTHLHFLDPVGNGKTNWHIGYQDVIAMGKLFTTGELDNSRVISLAGPKVKNPRLIRTRLGVCLKGLTHGELIEDGKPNRIVSGSVLGGRLAVSDAVDESEWLRGLGRYHNQVSVVEEMPAPKVLDWALPGFNKFSVSRLVASSFLPRTLKNIDTSEKGGHRAIFPVAEFDKIMPLDILPVFLCRALEIGDLEQSEALGALELDEEDLALCTFVDPGKNDFGANLRAMLTTIAKEG